MPEKVFSYHGIVPCRASVSKEYFYYLPIQCGMGLEGRDSRPPPCTILFVFLLKRVAYDTVNYIYVYI